MSLLSAVAMVGQNPTVLNSAGKMYVGGANATTTSIYIQGSAKFTSNSVNQTKVELAGQMELTGDLIDDMAAATTTDADMLVNSTSTGTILFSGKDVKQSIYRTNRGITSTPYDGHYLYIPNLYVRQQSLTTENDANLKGLRHVALEPSASLKVNTLSVRNENRFRVNASYRELPATQIGVKSGHLYLDNLDDNYSSAARGYSEVFMELYDGATGTGNASSIRPGEKNLTGFGSPFTELGADHMFFNVLTKPSAYSVTSYNGPILNPEYKLTSGYGHFIAMDVSSFDHAEIEGVWGNDAADRAKGTYEFSRYLLNKYDRAGGPKENFSRFANGAVQERFNVSDVVVNVRAGLNFLANPFMSPIDLTPLLNPDKADSGVPGYEENYRVAELGSNVIVSREKPSLLTAGEVALRDRYWVVANSSMSESGGRFLYTVSYYDVLPLSGTAALGKGASTDPTTSYGGLGVAWADRALVAPMQMFVVQASGEGSITLKKELRTLKALGKYNNQYMPKAAKESSEETVDLSNLPDQLLLQAEVVGLGREDRMCVVFTDDSKFNSTDYMDTRKGLAESLENDEKSELGILDGMIYTKATDGNKGVAMLTNSVPKSTKQLAVYVHPTYNTQEMVIRPYRMETLKDIQGVWLEDKFEKAIVELTPETEYRFVSHPLAGDAAKENRFVLHFNESPEGWEDGSGKTADGQIVCYYQNTSVNIIGLNDGDVNSRVQVYDMQGRMVYSSIIKDAPKSTYLKSLAQGTYILKIIGKRNFTGKFVCVAD